MRETPKIKLTQFDPQDRPTWLGNYNGDMSKIDTAIAALDAGLSNIDTAIATLDAGLSNILNMVYPVGSIYESTTNASPATFIGGTWESYGAGCVLVGNGEGYTVDPSRVTKQGGASTVTLTSSQMPSHGHSLEAGTGSGQWGNMHFKGNNGVSGAATLPVDGSGTVYNGNAWGFAPKAANTGGGQAHENMPPYIVVYRWRRTG